MPGRVAHIDGDYLCYYAAGNDDCEPGTARAIALAFVQKALDRTGAEKAVMHLTASGCHKGERYLAATVKPYQGQRSSDRRPKNWAYLREWTQGYEGDAFVKKVWASREADDGMAACAAFAVRNGRLDAIVTADKDMRMLPGVHLDWKDHSLLVEVPEGTWEVVDKNGKVYGDKWFWLQMLQGDGADNIPGLEFCWMQTVKSAPERMIKCGPKTAEKLLSGIEASKEAYAVVIDQYRRCYRGIGSGVGDDRFCEQACLLWLRQDNKAEVTSFAQKWGYLFDDAMWRAVARLDERVKKGRAAINALGS